MKEIIIQLLAASCITMGIGFSIEMVFKKGYYALFAITSFFVAIMLLR